MEKKRIKIRGEVDENSVQRIKKCFNRHLTFSLMKDSDTATHYDKYCALALTLKDDITGRWVRTKQHYYDTDPKRVYYLSMEFYIGRFLRNTMICLNNLASYTEAMRQLGLELCCLFEYERETRLGNAGLGILAASFLDSMATVGVAGYGYGIRYNFGSFKQTFRDGWQCETPDEWLFGECPWEIPREDRQVSINLRGHVELVDGHFKWINTEKVIAMAYDYPIPGFANNKVNTLRLWSAKSATNDKLESSRDYFSIVTSISPTVDLTSVLYPNDSFLEEQVLRLKQEYFLAAATLHDIIRRFKKSNRFSEGKEIFKLLPQRVAIHLNDSHPAIAIPELMRILIDEEELDWDDAWSISCQIFSYTINTLFQENIERWPVTVFETLLPRHLQIIYNINFLHLDTVANIYPDDVDRKQSLSIFEEVHNVPYKKLNMASLCIVGSHTVNSVAVSHGELIKSKLLRAFHEFFPKKFQTITSGISTRRWMLECNPKLADAIESKLSNKWVISLNTIKDIQSCICEPDFLKCMMSIKKENKKKLAKYVARKYQKLIDPDSIYDVHIKRISGYKRQLLNCLHIITKYCRIKYDNARVVPRTVLFGGKVTPSYGFGKLIIKFINNISERINNDCDIGDKLKVIFLENYSRFLAGLMIPAADLNEQISLAGTQACGTSIMKLMLNGALTIGTLDGVNIEVAQEVGEENMFIFGLDVDQIHELKQSGYNPMDKYDECPELKRTIDMIKDGYFNEGDPGLFDDIYDSLMGEDEYLVLADFKSYMEAQDKVEKVYCDREEWARKALLNIACSGKFSSDRMVKEYAQNIWKVRYQSL